MKLFDNTANENILEYQLNNDDLSTFQFELMLVHFVECLSYTSILTAHTA